ncbi:MAG: hypothetical protein HOY71_08800 [Nonomuraea sp.]|nr:hypothetical protein [Nonomuraea sp.]
MSVTAERVTVPLADAPDDLATLAFGHGVDRLSLTACPGLGHLLEADLGTPGPVLRSAAGRVDVDYPHLGVLRRAHPSSISLDSRVTWTIEVSGGAHDVDADLTTARLAALRFAGGVTGLALVLDAPDGPTTVEADWLDDATIRRPRGVDVRVEVSGHARGLTVDGRHLGHASELALQSAFYNEAAPGYLIRLGQAIAVNVEVL